jgi:hypothetical protein
MQNFFEALTKRETAPEEAAKLLDELFNKLSEELGTLDKQVLIPRVIARSLYFHHL